MVEKTDSSENLENPIHSNNPEEKTGVSDIASSNAQKSEKIGGLKNPLILRIGVYAVTFIVMVMVVWGVGSLIVNATLASPGSSPTAAPTMHLLPGHIPTPIFSTDQQAGGIYRQADLQITVVSRPEDRDEVITYIVEQGDTIFGIADKFGLNPETVLWANRYIIGDTPDGLAIGVELYILPEDGVYHRWDEGEGLNGVASFYGVDPDVIVNYPLNGLSAESVGDYSNPNIQPGTMLVVPGGERSNLSWVAARDDPASGSSYLGPHACGGIIYGSVGTGTFTWPTTATWLSGYDYTPPVHNGLDFDGDFGSPIYASDSGVIVYSGWSDRGYGNLIVVDHDDGWQTVYAHLLDGSLFACGSNVQKGQLIASMGSTGNSSGPHLHFELRLNGQPMNPWQFLN